MKKIILGVAMLVAVSQGAWAANEIGTDRPVMKSLPLAGEANPCPWAGTWWPYSENGIAWRFRSGDQSPAEKYDRLFNEPAGRKIDTQAMANMKKAMTEVINPLQSEMEGIAKQLNAMINGGDNNWRNTDLYKKYAELSKKVQQEESRLNGLFKVDTATEFESIYHGDAVYGLQSWFGHCNAWAAAACIDPEPVKDFTYQGVCFNVGDLKGLLTESWMDCSSDFIGSRCEAEDNNDSTAYQDVTPSQFQTVSASYLGQQERAFVIDRHTGAEVWNQPVKSFSSQVVRELPAETRNGQKVYPVLMKATLVWVSDGVAPDCTNASLPEREKFESRVLTYQLDLDKPLKNGGRILPSGKWLNKMDRDHCHPDFIWVPTGNLPARQHNNGEYYENPNLDYNKIKKVLLPLGIQGS